MHNYILLIHVLAATIWTGGHLILALRFLPKALKTKEPDVILQFESKYETIGMPSLIIQIITGLWLAHRLVPDVRMWFTFDNNISTLIFVKLVLLVLTIALALHSRLRIAPHLDSDNLSALGIHIIAVTIISVLFVIVGVSFRTGGIF